MPEGRRSPSERVRASLERRSRHVFHYVDQKCETNPDYYESVNALKLQLSKRKNSALPPIPLARSRNARGTP